MEVVFFFIIFIVYIAGELFNKKYPSGPYIPMRQEKEDESERYQKPSAEHKRRKQAKPKEKYKPRDNDISGQQCADEAYNNKCNSTYDHSHKTHAPYENRKSVLPIGNNLAQAIVLGEILGKPKAKKYDI